MFDQEKKRPTLTVIGRVYRCPDRHEFERVMAADPGGQDPYPNETPCQCGRTAEVMFITRRSDRVD